MAKRFPSDEWFEELQRRLNNNEQYAGQASGYGVDFNGDYVFTIQADDQFDDVVHYFVGLEDGVCTEVREIDSPADVDNGFALSAPYESWAKVIRGELGAIEGIMSGDLELNGPLTTLLQYQDAARTFVDTCSEIDTDFV